ncbi:serine threonine protein kinase [Moniliophthora roreri MCA 2997]|uniref:Serine threonine protein kinase n=1 Tax=Moniliophthora roreri (strain MCA 2997) TaxID=1381753 RepID=V2XNC9_MONRO|nr:serine threonine protein kinase [Moniliophthora roreri MCA 2997]
MSHRSWKPSLASSEEKDKLENYDIAEQLVDSHVFCILKARCTRGRLKGRLVALKRSRDCEDSGPSETLHQALYHPNIVSLLSAFSSPQHRFQVLEFCPGGTLSELLKTRSLSEVEARTIVKPLIDVLSYLSKEAVVHRNINPDHILFTGDLRVKLSSFTFATQLPAQGETNEWFLQNPQFVAPEILSRKPYDCTADLWSLGVIIFACLCHGELPFRAPTSGNILSSILRAQYTIPTSVSKTANNLISYLIDLDPSHRSDLQSLAKHPFFCESSGLPREDEVVSMPKPKLQPFAFRAPSSYPRVTIVGKSKDTPQTRFPLREIQNADLRRILSDEVSNRGSSFDGRRIASDSALRPFASDTPLDSDIYQKLKFRSSSLKLPRPSVSTKPRLSSIYQVQGLAKKEVQLRQEIPSSSDSSDTEFACNDDKAPDDTDLDALPIGTSRPSAFSATSLPPRAHKTVNGNIIILSSRSLLVDFREGERRRGQKGSEVLLVNPAGDTVEVYEAPDIATPINLTVPTASHALETLPRRYWKYYNDAGILLKRIKQRTPKIVFHEPNIRCTLMANGPPGDIELMFMKESFTDTDLLSVPSSAKHKHEQPVRRLQYSRQDGTLEIASYISGPRGNEWETKTHHLLTQQDLSSNLPKLDCKEELSVSRLRSFLRIVELLESTETDFRPPKSHSSSHNELPSTSIPFSTSAPNLGSSRTIGRSLSTIDLAPRPPKFSTSISKTEMWSLGKQNSLATNTNLKATDTTPTWCKDDSLAIRLNTSGVQSKFIPSVGWCIRHGSRVSQGGRYKVMFLDGAVLDVDVDEEWVEFDFQDGLKKRRSIRDCHSERALGDRMKAFEEFVSMYDADT